MIAQILRKLALDPTTIKTAQAVMLIAMVLYKSASLANLDLFIQMRRPRLLHALLSAQADTMAHQFLDPVDINLSQSALNAIKTVSNVSEEGFISAQAVRKGNT